MEFQLSYFKSWKMMLWTCCTQYASKFGKLSSGHRTGKGQFSFQSQRKEIPKNIGGIDVYNSHIFLLDWSLDHYVVSFLISCNLLYFKVYFVWHEDCYSSFHFFSICMEYIFHPLTISLYVSLSLKWVSCRQHIYGPCFCIHSASLCLLVGAFNPFTFKVIVDVYVSIAIFVFIV